jgi:hypothetical protein
VEKEVYWYDSDSKGGGVWGEQACEEKAHKTNCCLVHASKARADFGFRGQEAGKKGTIRHTKRANAPSKTHCRKGLFVGEAARALCARVTVQASGSQKGWLAFDASPTNNWFVGGGRFGAASAEDPQLTLPASPRAPFGGREVWVGEGRARLREVAKGRQGPALSAPLRGGQCACARGRYSCVCARRGGRLPAPAPCSLPSLPAAAGRMGPREKRCQGREGGRGGGRRAYYLMSKAPCQHNEFTRKYSTHSARARARQGERGGQNRARGDDVITTRGGVRQRL